MSLLEGKELRYAWRRGALPAVDGVSLNVEPRSQAGIVGPNGAGKSTLLRLLAGLLAPAAGQVTYEGKPIGEWPRLAFARRVAYVPQSVPAEVPFTALEFALAGRFPHVGYFGFEGARDREIARKALAQMDVEALADRPFGELSGGEQARVMVARALAQEPDLLLLDEPTAFLDLGHRLDLWDRLRGENKARGLTVVVVTHDLNLAAEYCDQLLLLAAGKAVASGSPAEVLTAERVSEVYRCRVAVDKSASGAPRVTPVPAHAAP